MGEPPLSNYRACEAARFREAAVKTEERKALCGALTARKYDWTILPLITRAAARRSFAVRGHRRALCSRAPRGSGPDRCTLSRLQARCALI